MTPDQLAALFSPELNLSPEARALAAHVASLPTDDDGWVEIPQASAMRLLQIRDERKLRRANGEAADSGWIEYNPHTGKGHHPAYRFNRGKNAGSNHSPAENVGSKPFNRGENVGLNGTSSPTPPPSPSTGAQAREDDLVFAQLRRLLTPHHEPLNRLVESVGGTSWAADVWGWYRPADDGDAGGTQWSVFSGLSREEALEALSTAIGDYASERKPWNRRLFRGFVHTAVREAKRKTASDAATSSGTHGKGGGGSGSGGPRRGKSDASSNYQGTTEWKGFNG